MSHRVEPLLPYPLILRTETRAGRAHSEEYQVPLNDKPAVLEMLYPAPDFPPMDEILYDVQAGKHFVASSFKVVREHGFNFLASPYYYNSGGPSSTGCGIYLRCTCYGRCRLSRKAYWAGRCAGSGL